MFSLASASTLSGVPLLSSGTQSKGEAIAEGAPACFDYGRHAYACVCVSPRMTTRDEIMDANRPVPPTDSLQAIAEFWETHSLADYWDQTEPADFELGVFKMSYGGRRLEHEATKVHEEREARSTRSTHAPAS